MERKGDDPPPPPTRSRPLPLRPALATLESNLTSSTSSSSSSSFSPPDFLRHVQAALKRHRPIGMHANGPRARRVLVSSGAGPPSVNSMSAVRNASSGSSGLLNTAASDEGKGGLPSGGEVESTPPPEDNASVTPPSSMGRPAMEQNGSFPPRKEGETGLPCNQQKPSTICPDAEKKVHSCLVGNDVATSFQSAAATRMTNHSGMGDISSHMTSLGLTERGGSSSTVLDPDLKRQDSQLMEMSGHSMMIGDTHLMDKRAEPRSNMHFTDPMTQGSVASSCFTALSLHSGHAQCSRVALAGQTAVPTQMSSYAVKSEYRVQEDAPSEVQGMVRKEHCKLEQQANDPPFDERIHGKAVSGDATTLRSQVSSVKESSLSVSVEPSQSTKAEKGSRKKKYDADSFFKVNGKFYQKLGKIGSGGSSEVYKVITSDCTIYALKRIVLKGRDYSTACGFYQEIEYLKKLRGKSSIIQLVDYEVTNEALIEEVINKCVPAKNGRIKDDVYIYMVLEYGEIDLAHMLLQKWKDFDRSSWKMDENWLRFYWQQMLEAVNTIHEERIVHSDLKPANFLLVRGSLKLIDFGIAKAISSDTTNIQRDSQVGTLNYMSPEAYMCNEVDASGNAIKCGRPSDIWSLGCILYQMVYGKTPFADYKTVWAKYKVVTDRNHQIVYEPVSNPWLIDLMRKCLAWDRNERWRIPQLLEHPFLVPPIPQALPPPSGKSWNSLVKGIEVYCDVPEVSSLLGQLQKLISDLAEGSTNSHKQI